MNRRSLWCLLIVILVPLAASAGPQSVTGMVFHDHNGDGARQDDEPGIADVLVSNGRDVAATDGDGRYRLAVREDMDVFVIQPQGWRVGLDERGVPRFHVSYKAGGSPSGLRFGGLPDPGEPPGRIDFALRPANGDSAFECAIIGDSQTYSNNEIGYFRDSAVATLLASDPSPVDCMIYVGDVVGDDLDLLDRLLSVGAAAGAPQWLVYGNHDMDLDADDPRDAADSWRRRAAPAWYAFEIGEVTFIALNNVVYPCGRDPDDGGHDFCRRAQPTYNGQVNAVQMAWLENLLDHIPDERLIVLLHHIPLVSFSDADSRQHQTDNAARIHALLDGRTALSVAGHTHGVENLAPGTWFAGWEESVGIGPLPFRHLIAGAASGA